MKNEIWSGLSGRSCAAGKLALSAWEPLPAMLSHTCLEAAPQQKNERQEQVHRAIHPPPGWAQGWGIDP